MEKKKKQLNLNAPFYSARQYSSPLRSSELQKPPLFQQPSRQQRYLARNQPEHEEGNDVITEPTSFVPFCWEQTPGRPKSGTGLSSSVRFPSGEIPKPPSSGRSSSGPLRFERSNDRNPLYGPHGEAFPFLDHASLLESLKCGTESEEEEEEEEEDLHCDELEILSRSLSYSMCGVSGCDGSGADEASGRFYVDGGTRDLMMDRFLPAAKAAVLETQTPKYVVLKKKSNVVSELPKKVIRGEEDAMPRRNIEEDEYVERHKPVKKPGKLWGIIMPRFCVANPLGLLHPLPALIKTPSFREVRRLTRKALSGPLDKIGSPITAHKKKFHSGLLPREPPSIEVKLAKDSSVFPSPRNSYSLSTSPLRRYRGGNSSPYGNETPKVNSNYNDGQLASSRKLFKALQDVSRKQKKDKKSCGPILRNSNNLDEPWPLAKDEEDGYEVKRVIKEEFVVIKSPLPPPLPKSPSEPWLWRTREQTREINAGVDSKWEAIVKSSNLKRETVRFSQELTPRGQKVNHSKGNFMKN